MADSKEPKPVPPGKPKYTPRKVRSAFIDLNPTAYGLQLKEQGFHRSITLQELMERAVSVREARDPQAELYPDKKTRNKKHPRPTRDPSPK